MAHKNDSVRNKLIGITNQGLMLKAIALNVGIYVNDLSRFKGGMLETIRCRDIIWILKCGGHSSMEYSYTRKAKEKAKGKFGLAQWTGILNTQVNHGRVASIVCPL